MCTCTTHHTSSISKHPFFASSCLKAKGARFEEVDLEIQGGLNITLAGISTKMKQVHLGSIIKAKQLSCRCLRYLTSTIPRHDITLFCGLVFEGTTLRSSICSCKSLELKSNKIKLANDHQKHMHIYYIYLYIYPEKKYGYPFLSQKITS